MVVIVDYKTGNIASIQNMIKKIGYESVISNDKDIIRGAEKLILPGVGSFDYGMNQLDELGLIESLNHKVLIEKIPLLGICLGAQLCCISSEEGKKPGLGWINATVKKFPNINNGKRYSVPHMGWDYANPAKESVLFNGIENDRRFYFVHSYYIDCQNPEDVLAYNSYSTSYHSAFQKSNIMGVQFHPEKSHRFGKELFKNFLEN
jgi:imidazole glycerol-phosphate synthase subunit HisH